MGVEHLDRLKNNSNIDYQKKITDMKKYVKIVNESHQVISEVK